MFKIFYPRFFAWINLFSLNHILLFSLLLLYSFQSIQTYVVMVPVFWTTPISTPKRYSYSITVFENDFFFVLQALQLTVDSFGKRFFLDATEKGQCHNGTSDIWG